MWWKLLDGCGKKKRPSEERDAKRRIKTEREAKGGGLKRVKGQIKRDRERARAKIGNSLVVHMARNLRKSSKFNRI